VKDAFEDAFSVRINRSGSKQPKVGVHGWELTVFLERVQIGAVVSMYTLSKPGLKTNLRF
jgi:hypothetical protein